MRWNREIKSWKLVRVGAFPDPTALDQRARSFAAAVKGSASLVTVRDGSGLSHYVNMSDDGGEGSGQVHLAQAVGGRADDVDSTPALSSPTVGYLSARSTSVAVRASQAGVDPAELVRRLAAGMRPGSWVGVSCRPAKCSELRRGRRWYEHRLGTKLPDHHTSSKNTLVVSVMAGGESRSEVRGLLNLLAATMPGFDVEALPKILSGRIPKTLAGAFAVAAVAAIVVVGGPWWSYVAVGVAALLTVSAVITDSLPTRARRQRALLTDGQIAVAPRRRIPPCAPKKERTLANGRERSGSDGRYPLASRAFLVGPSVVVGLVAPHAGALSGALATDLTPAPSDLLKRIGPAVGTAGGSAELVYIDAASLWSGVSLSGLPGSGKSALLRALFGWHCLDRVSPSGIEGSPGATNALVVFESKGDGAQQYLDWSDEMGDRTALVEIADPAGWAIDLFAVPGTPEERASLFVNAMVYAFGANAIGDRSYEALVSVFTAALVIDDRMAVAAGVGAGRSPVWLAHVLLGGHTDELAVGLAAQLRNEARFATADGDARAGRLNEGVRKLAPLFGQNVGREERLQLCGAARNKVMQLVAAEGSWWTPARRKITWDRVLSEHRSVVINTGISTKGLIVDHRLTAHMSAMIMFSLREAIMRNCSGWQAQGRSVTIFVDELSLVAGASPEVVTWIRNQGRSYGLRPIFATQYPEQLDKDVRTAFLSFGTTFWFAQNDATIAAAVAEDLSLLGEEWLPSDVACLEKHVAVLRATVDQRLQPPVPVNVIYWERDLSTYAARQGWVL